MKLKGLLSAILGAAMLLGTTTAAFANGDLSAEEENRAVDFSAPSKGLNVAEHSRGIIRQYIDGHPFDMTRAAEFSRTPQTYVPYKDAGKLSDADLTEARNALNVMRFIAGVGIQDVVLCPYSTQYAQCAALANFKNGYLSHNPAFIQGIDGTTWAYAKFGAQNSNVSVGFNNAAHSVVMGYLYDTNDKNIALLGHRRWCLNPTMYLTGFGQVGNYSAMWATDKQITQANNSGICWPARNMPVEYFPADTAWSVSMCEDVPADNVKVILTRKSDLRVWEFSNEHADGYFNVSNDKSIPLSGCIIFRPDGVEGYSHGDVFNVTIEGLGKEVSYNVNFFDLNGDDSVFEDTVEDNQPDDEDEKGDVDDIDEQDNSGSAVTVEPDNAPAEEREFISEDTGIQITADPDVFPSDTIFKAEPIGSGCSATRYTCDLSFICGGQSVQPNGCVRVSIPVPSCFSGCGALRVYHVENGYCSLVQSNIVNGRVCFSASSFSPYIITTEELDGQPAELSGETPADEIPDSAVTVDEPADSDMISDESGENTNDVSENVSDAAAALDNEPAEQAENGAPQPEADNVSAEESKSGENPNTGIGAAMIPIAAGACVVILVFKRNKEQFFK